MDNKSSLLNKEVILIDWDWPDDKGPKCVEALITSYLSNDKYEISLSNPLVLPDGSLHRKLIIEGRHKGHPVIKIIPNFIRKIFIFNHPWSRVIAPFVAINIFTENGIFFSIACIYLKSVYLNARRIRLNSQTVCVPRT